MKTINKIACFFLIVVTIGFVLFFGYVAVTNVDKTPMRLLFTYWREYLGFVVAVLALYFVIDRTDGDG